MYLTLFFNLTGLNIEQLSSISLFTSLLGDISTKQHSIEELSQEIRDNIGSLSIVPTVTPVFNNRELATPMLEVHVAVLKEDLDKAISIVQEILLETNFNKEEIKPICLSFTDGEMINRLTLMGIDCHIINTEKPFDLSIQSQIIRLIKDLTMKYHKTVIIASNDV